MTIIHIICGFFIIILLISLLLTIHALVVRLSVLETVVVEIYDSLVNSYKFSAINSTHINELWNKVVQKEITKDKPTIN